MPWIAPVLNIGNSSINCGDYKAGFLPKWKMGENRARMGKNGGKQGKNGLDKF
jgi:hypothetical protein